MDKTIPTEACSVLNVQPSFQEVKEAFLNMAIGKCLGPDLLSVQLCVLNATTISLIPKTEHPSSVKEYRPISCCNIFDKAITKVLMNRMRPLMHGLISLSQSAFIAGRNLGDSVLMLQELVQGYHKEDGVPRATIKIDLQKAYDMVEWENLWVGMSALGFPQRFIFLLQRCITEAKFSININGTLKGWFSNSRGLRQGGPISSYLFILVLEIFNGLMREASCRQEFTFHPHYLTGLRLNCDNSKAEGGLGFKSLVDWNTVCLCKLLRNISSRKEMLRVKWVHTVRLKGRSVWGYKKKPPDPWYWKKLNKVRLVVQNKYSVSVQNGEDVSFWFDCWAPFGFVWGYQISGHEFIAWMLFHGKMNTKDRLLRWGLNVDPKCVFFVEVESQNHLFFECQFSAQIWRVFGDGQKSEDLVYHRVIASVHGRASLWRCIKRTEANWRLCL
ncbi:hypothetical protein LIER_16167 [Lithospermum erythrorhizon]|uniref:Reverse transcriptase domain-containing protein n=1 Tax=Lithospermum erythrorhizon TaxID=34254 RepID=A0AAV3Q5L2_LITER